MLASWRRMECERASDDKPLAMSDESLRALLDLIYHATLVEEEGRPTRFSAVVGREVKRLIDFEPPLELGDVDSLRRLAHAASAPDAALHVMEVEAGNNGEVRCAGICDYKVTIGARPTIGSPSVFHLPQPGTISIRAAGPGHLVGEIAPSQPHILRGGKLRSTQSFEDAAQVAEYLTKLSARLRDLLLEAEGSERGLLSEFRSRANLRQPRAVGNA